MVIWRTGRSIVEEQQFIRSASIEAFLAALEHTVDNRLPGLAVFMSSELERIPPALSLLTFRWHTRYEDTFLLTVRTADTPYVADAERVELREIAPQVHRVVVRTGFMETLDTPAIVQRACRQLDLQVTREMVTYVIGHETIVRSETGLMSAWTESVFALLARNAEPAIQQSDPDGLAHSQRNCGSPISGSGHAFFLRHA